MKKQTKMKLQAIGAAGLIGLKALLPLSVSAVAISCSSPTTPEWTHWGNIGTTSIPILKGSDVPVAQMNVIDGYLTTIYGGRLGLLSA